ncbi:MAG: SDR family oxidoreductase, partial [Pseudomonadota bacterium]
MGRLDGKIALVTGFTSGIGREAALAMAREGAAIVGTGRREDAGEKSVALVKEAGGTARFLKQEITEEADWVRVIDDIRQTEGRLDISVNSAGVFYSKPLPDTSPEDFAWMWRVNVEGSFLAVKHSLSLMRDNPSGGSIMNMSSLAGLIGLDDCVAYCSSKAAVTQLSIAAAVEVAREGLPIRINSINPGVIWTEMITEQYGGSPEVRAFAMNGNALQTVGEAKDVASAVVYLASDAARYVTATAFVVDGGRGAD